MFSSLSAESFIGEFIFVKIMLRNPCPYQLSIFLKHEFSGMKLHKLFIASNHHNILVDQNVHTNVMTKVSTEHLHCRSKALQKIQITYPDQVIYHNAKQLPET